MNMILNLLLAFSIDIFTLIVAVGVIHIIQFIVFLHQYLVNKVYKGVGWWLLWITAEILGFGFMILRNIIPDFSPIIILQNSFIILGVVFIYIGIVRFLDRNVNYKITFGLYSIFVLSLAYFLFIQENLQIRSLLVSIFLIIFATMTIYVLLKYKTDPIKTSAYLNASVFVFHNFIILYRAIFLISNANYGETFSPNIFNILLYIDAMVVGLIWTFGFIVMLNQRLNYELKEAKNHFESIFNTSPDAALITRLNDGLIIDINNQFTVLTGYTKQEAIGKRTNDIHLWADPYEREKFVKILTSEGHYNNFESIFRFKDGTEIVGLISGKVVNLNGTPHLVSLTRDITLRKKLEKEILKLNAELEERVNQRTAELISSNKELSDFTYVISHNLRAPLRAIVGYSSILNDDFKESLDDNAKNILSGIKSNASEMGKLIDNLLEFISLNRKDLKIVDINMKKLFLDVFNDIPQIQRDKIKLNLNVVHNCKGDYEFIYKVVKEIFSNSIKFANKEKELIINVVSKTDNSESTYTIEDNGIGFDMKYVHKIFGVFEKLHKPTDFEGTGVGLAIAQRIINRHNGKIWATSEIDKGSTFYFSLPAVIE